ncbi:hypothetical protein BKN38_08560 [Helicobacter sp. CLO-3]|uniref:peroxide stress protein YaaA n=1 Tax=unclassified Helicobacter TaxID=2593540 RepID=UPI000804EC66|nr:MULTISPECIES: peroxide stress protein YaaA [unclassified Helicobacter]OBV29099.1 hypothetical protein BA723_06935 [Helicobacter sp. CLO-3]OHU81676.1 hypothetical protein BKN38_08560 [Helicobacter sp. CLO-3]
MKILIAPSESKSESKNLPKSAPAVSQKAKTKLAESDLGATLAESKRLDSHVEPKDVESKSPESKKLDSSPTKSATQQNGIDSILASDIDSAFANGLDSSDLDSSANSIDSDPMWGGLEARRANIRAYLSALKNEPDTQILKIFGAKRLDANMLASCLELLQSPRVEAIELYNGVAFKALDFASLDSGAQDFIRQSALICSNLFGLVRASDALPYYHLNQNYTSKTLNLKSLYKAQSSEIDALLDSAYRAGEMVLDLRAGVYIKAYPLKIPHFTLKMPTKSISHQAKLYRGLALRNLAIFISQMRAESKNAKLSDMENTPLKQYIQEHFAPA